MENFLIMITTQQPTTICHLHLSGVFRMGLSGNNGNTQLAGPFALSTRPDPEFEMLIYNMNIH